MLVLNDKLAENRLAVIDNTLAIKAVTLPTPQADNKDIVQALADVKAELKAQSKQAEERIKQAEQQAAAAEAKSDKLIESFNKSSRTYERQMDEWQSYNKRQYVK